MMGVTVCIGYECHAISKGCQFSRFRIVLPDKTGEVVLALCSFRIHALTTAARLDSCSS